ncbi:MAG: aminotransferase class I/II-fold pyridoxal phosphate-dependent enzyme [Clostridium sp.]|uniref:pyridoxal phosphate-dependent aminotransferase n=1 Tax=Clostridium sp. TaxID=1506 RepID=UPI00290EDF51|nr:aminotransferase class I/II-fold pyridoxal phosphate-dependent enzyme [Clostridium sp.]MDU5106231.1 aminotransferase class I/II-fold pyridoxal phosphate-dependent enzyme [Clostridium sp.]MDU5111900.1 aminotransferase class I/II-fold pyridoxal phosphate-dependent enzyme [Clostridium sp.]
MNYNLDDVQISGIRMFFNKVKEVPGAISLTLGQPDFEMPKEIKLGMIKAIEEDKTIYTDNLGVLELREEVCNYLKSKNINYSKEEICITVGGSEGLFSSIASVINKGDKVLIPTPGYPAYENIVKILGGVVVYYELNEDFTINIEELDRLIVKGQIKYMILSYPSNPTGAILNYNDYCKLANLIKKYNLLVITDEVYEAFTYEEYHSIAMNEELKENIIYVGSFSKMLSATGVRLGFIASNRTIIDEINKVHQYCVSCANSIAQFGILEGLRNGLYNIDKMKKEFMLRKDYVEKRLKDMDLEFISPKGAFYIFPSIKKFNLTSEEFCLRLLKEKKIACVPGSAFGYGGEGYIRMSYCYSSVELKEALDSIEIFIKELH